MLSLMGVCLVFYLDCWSLSYGKFTILWYMSSKEAKAELIGSLKLKLLVLKNLIFLTPFCYFIDFICLLLLPYAVVFVVFDGCVLD